MTPRHSWKQKMLVLERQHHKLKVAFREHRTAIENLLADPGSPEALTHMRQVYETLVFVDGDYVTPLLCTKCSTKRQVYFTGTLRGLCDDCGEVKREECRVRELDRRAALESQ